MSHKVAIVMGSGSDRPVMEKAGAMLEHFGIEHETRVLSAHKTPDQALEFAGGRRTMPGPGVQGGHLLDLRRGDDDAVRRLHPPAGDHPVHGKDRQREQQEVEQRFLQQRFQRDGIKAVLACTRSARCRRAR